MLRPTHAIATIAASLLMHLLVSTAGAAEVTVTFTGTVISTTGDLNGPIATSDTISGSITYETTTAGSFTPSPNPTFVRSQMLYSGSITQVEVTVNGDTVSGSAGDTQIFDAIEMLAGEDSYEITATLDTGTIAGVSPASFFWNPSFDYQAYALMSGDPLPDPLPEGQATFLQFNLTSAGGGTAYGSITGYTVASSPPPVPALTAWGLLALAALLGWAGLRIAVGEAAPH